MGIYIKGMEMPRNCFLCKLSFVNGERLFCTAMKNEEVLRRKIDSDCPIVPVPPHGRLIDADALGNSLEKLAADKWNQKAAPINWSYAFEECLEMLDNAPTVIEQNFINAPTIIPAEEDE